MARATVSIGTFSFPEPSTYEATTATLVDSGRNAQGQVIGSVLNSNLAKVSMTWKYLTGTQWSNILKQFEPKYGGKFYQSVTFLDQLTNGYTTKYMYVSDRKAGIFHKDSLTGEVSYSGCSLSLVDMGKN